MAVAARQTGEFKKFSVNQDGYAWHGWLRFWLLTTPLVGAWDFLLAGSAQTNVPNRSIISGALGRLHSFERTPFTGQQWTCFVVIGIGMLVFFPSYFGTRKSKVHIWVGFLRLYNASAAGVGLCMRYFTKSLCSNRLAPSNIFISNSMPMHWSSCCPFSHPLAHY